MQVRDGPAGTDHVLRLLAQPATQPVAHVDAALGTPLLGRGGGDQVGGRAFEHDRLEHVERGADAVEHAQLLDPGHDGRRLREPGLGGHLRGARDQRRQGRVEHALEPTDRVVGVGPRPQVRAVPGRVGGPDPERAELSGLHEDLRELRAAGGVEHAGDVGREAHGRLRRRPGGGEAGQLLERVVRRDTPRSTFGVQGVDVGPQTLARADELAAQRDDTVRVDRGRLEGHRPEQATGDRRPPPGLRCDVQEQVAEAEDREPVRQRGGRSAVPGHVEDGAAGRGRIRDEGGQGAGHVGAGGRVHEQVRARGHDVEDVLLRRVEVADATLVAGVAVAAHRGGQHAPQPRPGLLDTRERGDHLVTLERARQVVEVVDEDLAGVHEGAHDHALAHREVVEDGLAEGGEPVQGPAGVEPVGRERAARDRAGVEQRAAGPQRARQDGVHLERGFQGELVVALAGAACVQGDGAQEHGSPHGPGRGVGRVLALGGPLPGHRRERRHVVAGDVRRGALGPGGHADGQRRGGDAVALGVDGGARAHGTGATSGGRQRGPLADEVGQPGLAPGVQLGDPGRVRGRQVEGGVAEQLDVDERRPAGGFDEGGPPGGDGSFEELGVARRLDEHGAVGWVCAGLRSLVGSRAGGAHGEGHPRNANRAAA